MTAISTRRVNITNIEAGHVVHFYGARFLITEVHEVIRKTELSVIVANGKWIDGEEVPCYFGKDLDWTFQGNSNRDVFVEN